MIKLDKKSNDLIAALLNNCRESNAHIGKQIGLSREVVAYRISSLEKEGVITGYTADINFNKLGFSAYSISIRLQNLSTRREKEIADYLKENRKIVYLQKTLSNYDFVFTILVNSLRELSEEIDKIREYVENNLADIGTDAFIGDYDFISSFFKKSASRKEVSFFSGEKFELNEKDKELLRLLVEDSRMSAVELSKKLKLSVFAIAGRIKKLVKENVILAFRPVVNMEKLSYYRYTLLLNSNPKMETGLVNFCRGHNLIWDVGKFVGDFNYAVEIFAQNNEQFQSVVDEILNNFSDNIIGHNTLIVLHELKHKYFF